MTTYRYEIPFIVSVGICSLLRMDMKFLYSIRRNMYKLQDKNTQFLSNNNAQFLSSDCLVLSI